MVVLHGGWLPGSPDAADAFIVWGEGTRGGRGRPAPEAVAGPAPRHPVAVAPTELRRALVELGGAVRALDAAVVVRLPSASDRPLPSRPWLWETDDAAPVTLRAWTVSTLALRPADVLPLLGGLPGPDDDTPGIELGPDLRYWVAAARFALGLLVRQRLRPALAEVGGGLRVRWVPLLDDHADRERLDQLVDALPPAARAAGYSVEAAAPAPRALMTGFLDAVVDAFAREHARVRGRRAARRGLGEDWLRALTSPDSRLPAIDGLLEAYREWVRSTPVTAADSFRVCFRLEPSAPPANGHARPPADWTLRYLLQAVDDPSLLVPAGTVWRERGDALAFLNRTFDQPQERLLMALGVAARLFPPLDLSLRQSRPEAAALTAEEAFQFVHDAAGLFEAGGFGVLLPDLSAQLGVRVRLSSNGRSSRAEGGVAGLSLDTVLDFDWQLALGDTVLSREEFEQLADLKTPLVSIRGLWVELRPEQRELLLTLWQRREAGQTVSLDDAIRLALAPSDVAGLPVTEVETDGPLEDLLGGLREPGRVAARPVPPGFVGRLRPYQQDGLSWMAFLRRYRLGACLADDMGLGKSVETIALLLDQRAAGVSAPTLLVCPTSVVSNWQHELARFAPELRVMVHHGGKRAREDFAERARQHDVVITSYALVAREAQRLAGVTWSNVIADEAQNVKNPDTRQAKALRGLPADYRLALTGTPVENRLGELWSLFQFLNPGYLGSATEFRARFARPIERLQDPDAARRLKSLVGPFILRRVKTDPTVIDDLPEKNEMKVFCPLTREQATLYEAVVRDSLRQIESTEGIERRGLVLATMLKLKQVCNHPAQFLKDGSALEGRSGKLDRLTEMLDEVRQSREHALIFTQFAEMARLLTAYLEETFDDEVLLLSGGTPRAARDRMIERFQRDPHAPFAFVLSLKAGGTGLNLTRASQVFHFDRWWNPAVENQATDRAFRIGQTRNVQVYKYLCAGTMEERIDEMIERKQGLAAAIVGTSESWITELSTDELRDVFALRREAVEA